VAVIGGGSAGLKIARRAARAGRSVALAEAVELGGECFWAGCVPTKALVRAAEVRQLVREAARFGTQVQSASTDFASVTAWKDSAQKAVGGDGPADGGLGALGVHYLPCYARFLNDHLLETDAGDRIEAETIVLAAGTIPHIPPIPGLAEAQPLTNRTALRIGSLPATLVVLGAGPIGLEFAQIFSRFGSSVTVLERGPRVLPAEDPEISALLQQRLEEEGIRFVTQAAVRQVIVTSPETRTVQLSSPAGLEELQCEQILCAAGRAVDAERMGVAAAGIEMEGRFVKRNDELRSSVPHIWAPGDVGGGMMFTHVAAHHGSVVAENLLNGQNRKAQTRAIPRATFTDPEAASVGLTEEQARAGGHAVKVHRCDMASLDRAVLNGTPWGLVKLVSDADSGELLGAHIVGAQAGSMLAEVTLAVHHRMPVSALAETMHAYPTFPEAVEAAALS
jgi:pyruvate/2-oxoglutarate dehydrogenase complex dihydrolipoamide dehydrogenase (E3) component